MRKGTLLVTASHLELRCCWSSQVLFGVPTYPAASLSPQDDQIERERASQHLPGGCCALAAIYLMGKFYVANAGDSRYSLTGQPSPFAQ